MRFDQLLHNLTSGWDVLDWISHSLCAEEPEPTAIIEQATSLGKEVAVITRIVELGMVIVAGTSFGDIVKDWAASKPIEHYKDLEASVGLE